MISRPTSFTRVFTAHLERGDTVERDHAGTVERGRDGQARAGTQQDAAAIGEHDRIANAGRRLMDGWRGRERRGGLCQRRHGQRQKQAD